MREVADLGFVAPEDRARVESEFLFGEAGIVGEEGLEQRGFAGAVAAHEADLLAAQQVGGEGVDDFVVAVELGDVLELEDVLAAGTNLVEFNVRAGDVGAGQIGGLQALDLLAAAGDLRRAGSGGEAGDELVELGDLLFALGVLGFEGGTDLGFGHHHVVVAAGIGDDGFVIDVGGVGGDGVEEVAIVGDGDEGAIVVEQEVLEPVDGVEIEIVCGLVEEEGFGFAEEGLGQQDANFLAALELGHAAFVEGLGDVQTIQEHGGVGLGGVAVFVADHAFEFA